MSQTWYVTFEVPRSVTVVQRRNPRLTKTFGTEAEARNFARLKFDDGLIVTAGTLNPHLPRKSIPSVEIPAWLEAAQALEPLAQVGEQQVRTGPMIDDAILIVMMIVAAGFAWLWLIEQKRKRKRKEALQQTEIERQRVNFADSREIRLNGHEVTRLHAAIPGQLNKELTYGVKCLVFTTDGKVASAVESCEDVSRMIDKAISRA